MPLHLQSLRCPHCQYQPSKEEQADKQWRQSLLAREPVNCHKCGLASHLPEFAEKLISVGLLASCIIAPALAFWASAQFSAIILFGLGIALVFIGAATQQLRTTEKADSGEKPASPTTQASHNTSAESPNSTQQRRDS